MSVSFLISPTSPAVEKLPRKVRVMLRKQFFHPAKPAPHSEPRSALDLDCVIRTSSISDPCGDGHQYNANTVDPEFDIDGSAEFDDHDDQYEGLTIVEPGYGNIRRWLRGRDIL